MALNYLWIAFFLIAFIIALVKSIFFGDVEIFQSIISAAFESAKTGFNISIGLAGVLTLWMGLMKIGEKGGIVKVFSKLIGPFFHKLFPELGKNHPAVGSIMMNFSANMLGLDNAATPLGLKAMEEMQKSNPNKDTASNAQIMFLVLNAAGLTIIPVSIMVYRAQMGAADPSDIFIPILLSTFAASLAGLISVSIFQRINLFNKVILAYIGVISAMVAGIIIYFSSLPQAQITRVSGIAANAFLFAIIIGFILMAIRKRVNVYEAFIEGAKDGFNMAVKIIPYLVAMLVAIGVFRASGAMDAITGGIAAVLKYLSVNSDFIPALPVAIMKPLSGSGARGLMIDAMKTYGADSFVGRLSCALQGTTDTTFYILALYFGSVGIKNTRYAVICGLIADFFGFLAAILLGYLFFH